MGVEVPQVVVVMKHKHGVLRGAKFSRRHSTYIPAAEPVLAILKGLPQVTKIRLGKIVPTRPGPARLTHRETAIGVVLTVRGGTSVQTIFAYTTDRDAVWSALQ